MAEAKKLPPNPLRLNDAQIIGATPAALKLALASAREDDKCAILREAYLDMTSRLGTPLDHVIGAKNNPNVSASKAEKAILAAGQNALSTILTDPDLLAAANECTYSTDGSGDTTIALNARGWRQAIGNALKP